MHIKNRFGLFFLFLLFCNQADVSFGQEKKALDLEPIVVSKKEIHLIRPFTLLYEKIFNSSFASPIETLSLSPLDLQSRLITSGIQADFSLRGSTFQGVLVLIDGQRINDPQTAHHNSDIPLTKEDIERIEVIPGVASSVFGPDAIGGAVNFITKKPKKNKAILESSFGEHHKANGLFSITQKKDNMGVRLSVENNESDGFRYDTDFRKFTGNLNTAVDIPDGEFDMSWGYQEKEFGAYDFYTPGKDYPSKEWTKTYLLNTGLTLQKSFLIKPNFLWRRHYDKFMLDKTEVKTKYLNRHRTDVYTPHIYFQKEAECLGKVGLGLEYGDEKINSTNLGKHIRSHRSVYVDEAKDITPAAALGLSTRFDDFDGFDQITAGSINFRYALNKLNAVSLGVSRSMRIPSFTELYYNDPTTVGDANLSAEKSLGYQLGYDFKKETVGAGLTLFLRQEEDCIDWVKKNPSDAKWKVENITEADVAGIECYLRLSITRFVALEGNYIYIDKRIDDNGYSYKYGPSYTRHLANTGLNCNLPFGAQTIEITYKKKPNRDGWIIVNTCFSKNLNKHSRIFLRVANLFNKEYQEIEGIPQPGRCAEAGLRLDW